jgi:glycosyltransferase involved in cell wall biosynthesis
VSRLRLALATSNLQLPQKHFVMDHTVALVEAVEATLFSYAINSPADVPLPTYQFLPRAPVDFATRRRLYPVAERMLSRAVTKHRPDVVHLHFMALGRFAVRAAQHNRVPLVSTVHALEPHLYDTTGGLRARYLRDQARAVLDSTDLFLPVSEYVRAWLTGLGVDSSRLRTHYLGVDTEFWNVRETPALRLRRARVVFVGNLTRLKGILPLLSVSQGLNASVRHELHVIGDGPLRAEVAGLSRDMSHVHVHGRMERARVRELIGSSTVLVLPTRLDQGIADAAPTVLMEAQAMGVPTVAYDVGGTREMVANPSQALVSMNDQDALSHAIGRVLSHSESRYAQLSDEVRSWVLRHRARDAQAAKTLAIYQNLVRFHS